MTTSRDSVETELCDNPPTKIETIVHINDDGRIVIPRDIRRILDIEEDQAIITVFRGDDSAKGIVEVDKFGRATIPVQLRRYLDIDSDELDLQVVISRVDASSSLEGK